MCTTENMSKNRKRKHTNTALVVCDGNEQDAIFVIPFVPTIKKLDLRKDIAALIGCPCCYCLQTIIHGDSVMIFRCKHGFHEMCGEKYIVECMDKKKLAICQNCKSVLFAPVIKQKIMHPDKHGFTEYVCMLISSCFCVKY